MQSREKIFVGILVLSLAAGLLFWPGSGAETSFDTAAQEPVVKRAPAREPDIHYVPTPYAVVEKMLEMAAVRKGDILYDLGCGDGRIVIMAAKKYGIRSVGIDIDPERIREANDNARTAGVTHLVEFREADLFDTDFREASVVTLYLLERLNVRLRPKLLKELKPGSRIVSHQFGMGDWEPEHSADVEGARVHLWTVPARPRPAN